MLTAKISESLPRPCVKHDFDRRVRIDAAIPIGLAIDADRRETPAASAPDAMMCAATEVHLARVEVFEFAGVDVDGADGQPRMALVEVVEVDQAGRASSSADRSCSRRRARHRLRG